MAVIAAEKPKTPVVRPPIVLKEEEFGTDSPIASSSKSLILEVENESPAKPETPPPVEIVLSPKIETPIPPPVEPAAEEIEEITEEKPKTPVAESPPMELSPSPKAKRIKKIKDFIQRKKE